MTDLETQSGGDDLRSSIESAFTATDEATAPETKIETPVETPEAKADRVRDEAGKFAKAEDAPAPKPYKSLTSLKKEAQAVYSKVEKGEPVTHDDVKLLFSEFDRRDNDFHKGLEPYKTKAQLADEFQTAMAQYQQNIQGVGASPPQVVSEMLRVDNILRNGTQEQRIALIHDAINRFGIDVSMLAGGVPQDVHYAAQMQNKIQELESRLTQFQQSSKSQEEAQYIAQIQQFSEGKEHFESLKPVMSHLMLSGQAKTLDEAYEQAMWANPELRNSLIEQQTKAAEEKARTEAHRQRASTAASSVRGSSPVSTGAGTPDSVRAAIEAAFNN